METEKTPDVPSYFEPVPYEQVRRIYTGDLGGPRGRRARRPRHAEPWNDTSMAIGGLVAAGLVVFLFVVGIVVSI